MAKGKPIRGTSVAAAPTWGWAFRLRAAWVEAGAALLLLALTVLPASFPRALAFLLVAGVGPLLGSAPRWSVAELLLGAPLLSVPIWGFFTWLGWSVGLHSGLGLLPAALAFGCAAWDLRKKREVELRVETRDLWAVGVTLVAAVPAVAVFLENGLQANGDFLARSWVARDSFFFFSFVESAIDRAGLPPSNLFVAGAPNLYPPLAYVAFGGLTEQSSNLAAIFVSQAAVVLLPATSGFAFLLFSRKTAREGRAAGALELLGAAVGVGGWVASRPDLFVYPQTQSLVAGAFLFCLFFWHGEERWRSSIVVLLVAAYLVLSHAVTAAATLAVLGALAAHHALGHRWRTAGSQGAAVAALGLLYLLLNRQPFSPARASDWALGLSETWPFVGPWVLAVVGVAVAVGALGRARRPWLVPLAPLALAMGYHLYGSGLAAAEARWFVHFNAERFIHYGVVTAFAFLPGMKRLPALVSVGLSLAGAVLTPALLVKETRLLYDGEPLRTTKARLDSIAAVRKSTPPDARILSFIGNFALPAFAGRAQAPVEPGEAWSSGALPWGEVNERNNELLRFNSFNPTQREERIRARGYTHLLFKNEGPAFQETLMKSLLPGPLELVHADGEVLLFRVAAPGSHG